MDITKIPGIMRANKMPVGAALMESWFSRPVSIMPSYGMPDMTTVTMKWVRGFRHADQVCQKMIDDAIWQTDPTRKQLIDNLTRDGVLGRSGPGGRRDFGDIGSVMCRDMRLVHSSHVNHRKVAMARELDDLAAALANFAIYVLVSGTVFDVGGNRSMIEIRRAGIYAMDSYDFEGSQFLGYWNEETSSVSMLNPWAGDRVSNASFRAWRSANLKGGDFQVFTDVQEIPLRRPVSFIVD